MQEKQIVLREDPPARRGASIARGGFEQPEWKLLASCSTPAARALVSIEHARRLCCLPIATWREDDRRLVSFLVPFGTDSETARELRFITDCEIVFEFAEEASLKRAIDAAYHAGDEHLLPKLARAEGSLSTRPAAALAPLHSTEAVPLLLEALLERADAVSASDIHLEPGSAGLKLRFRIDGLLQPEPMFSASKEVAAQLFRRLKLLSKLDTTCDFKPQEGGFTFALHTRELRLRVSFVPQHHGEKAVIRLLENNAFAENPGEVSIFCRLGLSSEQERLLSLHLGAGSGGIVLAGPTGSGKSTLLYAALEYLNAAWRNIVTLEDPVERTVCGINQLEVNRDSVADMLPALLRQDPDVIMVGEIRDKQTGETALSAAITGHLVLSTVHAGSALEILPRLLQLGVSPQLLSCSLRLLVSQRLLPLNCRSCVKKISIPEAWRRALRLDDTDCYAATGCAACRSSGIMGRRGVFEFLPIGPQLREWIWRSAQTESSFDIFVQLARDGGYVPLAYAVRTAVLSGEVSPQNALKALGIAPEVLGGMRETTEFSKFSES